MLQKTGKEKATCFLLVAFSMFLMITCKPDQSLTSDAETAYMADYEPPANKWGFIDKTGTLIIDPVYDGMGPFSEGLAAVNVNGKWGYINPRGTLIIPPRFKSAWAFHNNRARVEPFDKPSHYVNKEGQPISSEQWSAVDDFSEGLARVKVGAAFGYIDTTGKLVIQPAYTRGWNFTQHISVVEFEEQLGVINDQGSPMLPFRYDKIKIYPLEKIILAITKSTSHAFDLNGTEILRLEGKTFVESDGHLVSVRDDHTMYFFDLMSRSEMTNETFINLVYLGENRWAGKKETGYLLLDGTGQAINETTYTQINRFVNGIAAYCKGEYWGYINHEGKELTGEVFGLAWDYKEGLARAAFKEGIAFIDSTQQLAFYPPYGSLDMRDFSEGMAAVQIAK